MKTIADNKDDNNDNEDGGDNKPANYNPEAFHETINKLNAISTGTKEKFMIIHDLRGGEKPYTEIHEIFPGTNRSTIYKYLSDLYQAGIIKKRVERLPGKRPIAYYSLAGLALDLSPAAISKLLGYGDKSDKETLVFGEQSEVKVIGKNGKETEFYPSILLGDLLDAGVRIEDAICVLNSVSKSLYDGISTTEIGDNVIKNLRSIDGNLAGMFEKFIESSLDVVVDSRTDIWNRDKISEMIKERRCIKELSTGELKFLSHKIIRNIKKLTQKPTEGLVTAYVDMLANTVVV